MKEWLELLDKEWDMPPEYLHKARSLRDQLFMLTSENVLLHGDLHHENILNCGIGSAALVQFSETHGNFYTHTFADPDATNIAAICTYEKAGFQKIVEHTDTDEIWMMREREGKELERKTTFSSQTTVPDYHPV